jgi:Tfp pilus assembly protein PilF
LADENYLRAFQSAKMAVPYGLPYAQFLLKRNQPQRAEKILEETLATSPGNMSVLRMLARSKISRGDWAGGQAVADQIKKLGDKENLAEQITGAIYAGQKNYAESISAFKRAYASAPTQVQPMVALVRTYLMAGKTKEAAGFLDSVILSNPNNAGARLLQGQLYSMTGEKQKAIDSFNSVIKLEPKSPVAYQQLAVLYLRNKQNAEAETVVAQGLSAVPGDMGLRFTKAGMLETEKKFEDAIKVYEEMLKERPDADVVANNLASLLSDRRTDKASLNRAFELAQRFKKTDVPQFKDTYGWASYKLGKYDDAKPMLISAAEQLPDMAVIHYHLGMNYLAKSDKTSARRELEKALQLAGKEPFEQSEEIHNTLKNL